MSVTFDEVVTNVETPPQQETISETQRGEPPSVQQELRIWQQKQAAFWQRQKRIEAD